MQTLYCCDHPRVRPPCMGMCEGQEPSFSKALTAISEELARDDMVPGDFVPAYNVVRMTGELASVLRL